MLVMRASRRAQASIKTLMNAIDASGASTCQTACVEPACMQAASAVQRRDSSCAMQPADGGAVAARDILMSWTRLAFQPAAAGVRGYAKGAAKPKHEKKKPGAKQESAKKGGGAAAAPESAIVDFSEETQQMEATLAHLKQELGGMRTGRASPGMLDHIRVEAYGEKMALNTLATVLTRDAQLLVAAVYDPSTLQAVEKAIAASPLGLNPRVDGQEILIPVPRPSAATQEAMSKLCKQEVEAAKVSVRNARHSGLTSLKSLASEDERFRAETELQRLTDKYIQLAEQLGAEKVKDINSV